MITTVGALSPGKGSDLLLEAWAKLAARHPEAHLVIVGPLFDENHPKRGAFRRKIEDLVTASGAADRVHLPGFVENVEDYLRASDLFVFSPLKGGMPNVVLEAMASGVPVILTPFIALPKEFGEPSQEYCLVKRDSNAIAAAIAELLQNEELRKNLGRRGRSWVEETMDLEQSLDRYASLYYKLAEQRRKRARAQ
jgi:glycosyltransferase involved in cell wall biosynthesis